MSLQGDHLVISYFNKFEGIDLDTLKHDHRDIAPIFSEEAHYMRDVQQVIDENYVNYLLFSLFYKSGAFSLSEYLFNQLPENNPTVALLLKLAMNTNLFQFFFPTLATEFGQNRRLDMKCGFNKDYLTVGHLNQNQMSRVTFHDRNVIRANMHFGCGIYVYKSSDSIKTGNEQVD